VREEKDGERRKKAKISRVVPHPKLNPGCATGSKSKFMVKIIVLKIFQL